MRIALASGNAHKLRELRDLLPGWEIEPLETAQAPEETGETFYENAALKARFGRAAATSGAWVLAEDSGLEVDGLDGRPGVRSARYAGADATDEENVARLLEELEGVRGDGRRGRYVSELVLLAPDGRELRGRGTLEGRIARAASGSEGFGYDPVFVPAGETRTVAELGNRWKAAASHRATAATALARAVGSAAEES